MCPRRSHDFCSLTDRYGSSSRCNRSRFNIVISPTPNDTSPSLLWETLKAVIRGEIISYSAKTNKMKRTKQEELIKAITMVDFQYSTSPSPELYKKKLDLQTQYNLSSTKKTERLLLKSRGYVYEHGDKAGRLLAHQLNCRSVSQQIPQIRNIHLVLLKSVYVRDNK